MAAFLLSKWYLDCVTLSGDVAIVYTGSAAWGPVRLQYSSILESDGGRLTTRQSLRPHAEPSPTNGALTWRSDPLHIDGEWRAAPAQALTEMVYQSDSGAIEWRCLMPHAEARIGNRHGLGYVEQLSMTIAPWRMPISTLRWGRFLSNSHSAVWIDWLGPYTRRIAYLNNHRVTSHVISDEAIEFSDGARLTFDRSLTLRDGPIGATALAAIPGIHKTFPGRLLQIHETKWRSWARLSLPGETRFEEGWAIHERVDWPAINEGTT